ncbi:cyclohexanone monooxygenase [Paraphoma chrysanthemicola]|uniref:Cyclohexanone monooxygenase n=1 Tax=Paraphoma chrysanthemicola TaxID=798071 RepID=A0A8K0R2L6_9PLEO|nr:cyclohexanone monooxygenase [Paraphoma chrysanthemicola]
MLLRRYAISGALLRNDVAYGSLVRSHLYSYSFEPNPNWTKEFSGQEEILDYLTGVAHKYGLYRYIRFNTCVDSARWDDTTNKWNVKATVLGGKDADFGGSTYTMTSDFVISGVGQLNQPKFPDVAGLEAFKGRLMHSARWDWSYDIQGKKVAVIGNGASAIQIVPEIADKVKHLTVYQRSPNWIMPREDSAIPLWKRQVYQHIPHVRKRHRANLMQERESSHDPLVKPDSPGSEILGGLCKQHLHAQLPNRPDLWEKLTPNYKVGCKRCLVSDDYYPVFLRDNVRLETGNLDRFTANGIVADGQEEEVDLIILATGFRAVEFLHPIEVSGTAGRTLSSVWKDGGHALYGVTVDGFPNFGMLFGPNTNLGHNSVILMIEAQSRYITALVDKVLTAKSLGGSLKIIPKSSRVKEFNDQLQAALSTTSLADPNCNSWYKLANGKITTNWSDTVITYQKILSQVEWSDYDVTGTGADELNTSKITKLGRVVEEPLLSDATLGLTILSAAALVAGITYRYAGRLLLL